MAAALSLGPFWIIVLMAIAGTCWLFVALVWCVRRGQFRNTDAQARVIFDAIESEGVQTDFFPKKGPPPSEYLL